MCANQRSRVKEPIHGDRQSSLVVLVRSESEHFAIQSAADRGGGGLRHAVLSYAEIPTDTLRNELLGFMNNMGAVFDKLPGNLGQFTLDEVELSLEITGKGQVGFLGTGGELGGSGGIKMTLRRKGPEQASAGGHAISK